MKDSLPNLFKNVMFANKNVEYEFALLDNHYRWSLEPDTYANFLLEYMSLMLLKVYKEAKDKYKTFAKMIMMFMLNAILDQEKTHSKAEAVFAKQITVTTAENASEDDQGQSGDEYAGYASEKSNKEFEDDHIAENNEEHVIDDLGDDAFEEAIDVENVADIYEVE
jgi:hypothetical protein